MRFLRKHVATVLVAMVTAVVAGAVPAAAIIANADRVDGFHANQLVRASHKNNNTPLDNFNPGSYQTVLSKTAKAPVRGILVLWGNVDAEWKTGTGSTTLQARILVDGHAVGTPDTEQQMDDSGFNHSNSAAMSVAVHVAKGKQKVALKAYTTEDPIILQGRSITTLFVPFGNGGIQGTL